MMFVFLVGGAVAWTVGGPSAPVVTSPVMQYVPALDYGTISAPVAEMPALPRPAPASSGAAWLAALAGAGALAGYAVGRRGPAALAVHGRAAPNRARRADLIAQIESELPKNPLVASLPGVSAEFGNKVWDPLGLSSKMDEENLNLIRAAELKHCRVAMLANVGWAWTATGTHFKGMLSPSMGISFEDCAAAGNPILAAAKVPGPGIQQIILAIGALEIYWEGKYPSNKFAGNFGVPPATQDPERLKFFQEAELKNGRLAMIGIISYAIHEAIPGAVPLYPFPN